MNPVRSSLMKESFTSHRGFPLVRESSNGVNILGIGIIFSRGLGIDCYENALNEGWQMPALVESLCSKGKKSLAYRVDLESVPDRTLLKKMRRSDKFSKMAVLAASDALKGRETEKIDRKGIGIILATAFGAHVTTFDFLDNILDYGEAGVSPTTFSNSVHNAAASYIASSLDIKGPTLTITRFDFPFQYAMQLAQIWLNEGRCEYVLAGVVEQYGDVMGYIYDKKVAPAHDGMIRPFNFNPANQVPGEGAVFFFLSKKGSENLFCKIEDVSINEESKYTSLADLNIIDADGMLNNEADYRTAIFHNVPVAAYSPLFGSMMIGSAFTCAAGALMLKNQMRYASPVTDNPYGINILKITGRSDIERICCTKYNCYREKAVVCLKKFI